MRKLWIGCLVWLLLSCNKSSQGPSPQTHKTTEATAPKIGILLVNHGSRSATWRNALIDLEKTVKDSLGSLKDVIAIETAFMEYTEPSIATRLKQMDSLGVTDVILIPIFLTVSPHTFEDIPTIVGLKEDPESMKMLKIENIERYKTRARVHITPLLDFTDVLKRNTLRRVKALSQKPSEESIVLIGYGDHKYLKEWEKAFEDIAKYVKDSLGIMHYEYGWCGHLVRYSTEPTQIAIQNALKHSKTAIVIPELVAHDEMFQIKIIGGGIQKVPNYSQKVRYKPDSILPDPYITQWIINISQQYVNKIHDIPS